MPNFIDPIAEVHAREVLDSRGNPTVECELQLSQVLGDVLSFHQVLLQVNVKLQSFVMETRIVTLEQEH